MPAGVLYSQSCLVQGMAGGGIVFVESGTQLEAGFITACVTLPKHRYDAWNKKDNMSLLNVMLKVKQNI